MRRNKGVGLVSLSVYKERPHVPLFQEISSPVSCLMQGKFQVGSYGLLCTCQKNSCGCILYECLWVRRKGSRRRTSCSTLAHTREQPKECALHDQKKMLLCTWDQPIGCAYTSTWRQPIGRTHAATGEAIWPQPRGA